MFPLVQNEKYEVNTQLISKSLTRAGISQKIDITGTSIGKRYARTNELGVPFSITIDSETLVTIRERDSKEKIRVSVEEVASVVNGVIEGHNTRENVLWRYPTHINNTTDYWFHCNLTKDLMERLFPFPPICKMRSSHIEIMYLFYFKSYKVHFYGSLQYHLNIIYC